MIEPSDFGRFLKERRKSAHLTQDELAAAINKSGQYISNIEKGKNNAPPNPSDIEALIKKLGCLMTKRTFSKQRLPRIEAACKAQIGVFNEASKAARAHQLRAGK